MFVPSLGLSPVWLRIYELLSRVWAWLRNFFSRHHLAAMFALTWATIKVGFGAVSLVFTRLAQAKQAISAAVQQANDMATGAGLVGGIFDLCNAIFPIWEFLVLVSLLLTVKAVLWAVSLIRYVYKNIPLKAT